MQECVKELNKTRYACFSHPEHSSQTPIPQRATTLEIPLEVFGSLQVIVNDDGRQPRIESFSDRKWSDEAGVREMLSALVHSLGLELAKRLVYRVQEWDYP